MKRILRSVAVAAILALLSTSVPAHAADRATEWDRTLADVERHLLSGEFAKARKETTRLAKQMTRLLGPGEGGEVLFGLTSLYRALAEAGLGEEREACWYWHVALAFNPLLVDFGLDRFGEPARFLLNHEEPYGSNESETAESDEAPGDGVVAAPRKKRSPRPDFPYGAKYFQVTGALVVLAVIDRDGVPRTPSVITPLPAASLTWTGLEALKRWRFEPARLDGEPVSVFYTLTINYRMRR